VSGTSNGWRGAGHEAHLYLNPDEDETVRAAHARAVEAGGVLDAKLSNLEDATSEYGGQLEGLEYSVKGLDSLRRKVATEVAEGERASDLVASTRDMNRYTICFPAESYSEGVAASFDHLQGQGLEPYNPAKTHKNTWNDPSYKGINTSWVDQDTGQFVEIQFHTPESFQVKSDNHALYELARSGSLDDDQTAAADWMQAERFKDVEVPPGHDATVPARPTRELNDFPPEALEEVRAKEAELKQSQASESPAVEEPESDRSADAAEPAEVAAAAEGHGSGESPDVDAKDAGDSPGVEDAQDQDAAQAELKQSQAGESPAIEEPESPRSADAEPAEVVAAAEDQGPGESADVDAEGQDAGSSPDVAAQAESAQDAVDEGPESEDAYPQAVDSGVPQPREPAEEQDPGDEAEAADSKGQDTGASYDDHEDAQMARIAAAADEEQDGGERDDYGDTSSTADNRERGGVGD
jgi:hypothetical protein